MEPNTPMLVLVAITLVGVLLTDRWRWLEGLMTVLVQFTLLMLGMKLVS